MSAGEFDFSSYETVPLSLTVRGADGAPVPHACVTVTDRWRRARVPSQGNVLAQTLTDENGDGVTGTSDRYPDDPTRALVSRYPSRDFDVLGFEDQYPSRGDSDYNDAVIASEYQVVTGAKGNIRDVGVTFHLLARGATYDHAFGIHLPGLPEGATGVVTVDRFLEDDAATRESDKYGVDELVARRQRRVEVFPSTRVALPPVGKSPHVNTRQETPNPLADSARVVIRFDEAIPVATRGDAPYDPYFPTRRQDGVYDVHLPGTAGFADRPAGLPVEEGWDAFLDDAGNPWVIAVPSGWRFPLESIRIENAYKEFATWAGSRGTKNPTWYDAPTAGNVSGERIDYTQKRDWVIGLPTP